MAVIYIKEKRYIVDNNVVEQIIKEAKKELLEELNNNIEEEIKRLFKLDPNAIQEYNLYDIKEILYLLKK